MTQHDPSARGPVPRYSAQVRPAHGEWANRPSEVPDPQSVPIDWSPSGMTHAGTPGAGYADHPAHSSGAPSSGAPSSGAPSGVAPSGVAYSGAGQSSGAQSGVAQSGVAYSGAAQSGGGRAGWGDTTGRTAAPGWTGHSPETDPAAGWNGGTAAWTGDGRPAAWNSIPDRVPAEWSTPEPPTARWTEAHSPAWNNAGAEPPEVTWHAAPEVVPTWGAVVPRPHADPPAHRHPAAWDPTAPPAGGDAPAHRHPAATPAAWDPTAPPAGGDAPAPRSASGARTPKKSKLIFAGALIAAALAGGGAGAGIMAAVGGDSAATAPAGQPPAGQAPGQAPPDGPAPTAEPTKAS
ncbi:hypothetical protein [Actinoplanes flavus]|uniref:Uncharacterized protein n=1 Tax=Actinoplanes flavus TaxID=2820290 RepID=A0ABS3UYV2_9ACTN|nr:hypothetical protein [Actinoplanes flavus]MBO3743760.1 hypothetical protein [Actinoplanes flavus]